MAVEPKSLTVGGLGLIIVTVLGFCGYGDDIEEQIFIYCYLVLLLIGLVFLVYSFCREPNPYFILASLVDLGFMAALIYTLVSTYTKEKVKANLRVSDAALTQFQFEPTNHTLYYNLNVTFVVPNHPNGKIAGVEASACYLGHRFSHVLFATTNTTSATNVLGIPVVFQGQQVVVFTGEELSRFSQECADGIYGIDVKLVYSIVGIHHLHSKLDSGSDGNYKLSKADEELIKGEVKFALKVPLSEPPITGLEGGSRASDATFEGDMIYST